MKTIVEIDVMSEPIINELIVKVNSGRLLPGEFVLRSTLSQHGKQFQQLVKKGIQQVRIDVSDLPTGSYVLELKTPGCSVVTQPFQVN